MNNQVIVENSDANQIDASNLEKACQAPHLSALGITHGVERMVGPGCGADLDDQTLRVIERQDVDFTGTDLDVATCNEKSVTSEEFGCQALPEGTQ